MADQNRITAAYETLAEESRNSEAAQTAAPPVPANLQMAYTAIMASLDGLRNGQNDIRNGQNDMRNSLEEVNNNIERLRQEMIAQDYNQQARTANSHVQNATQPLKPLRKLNGDPIEGFPRSLSAISRMNGANLDRILGDLGEPTTGTVDDRRVRLKNSVGSIADARREA
jgi:hypothetical protein